MLNSIVGFKNTAGNMGGEALVLPEENKERSFLSMGLVEDEHSFSWLVISSE